MPQPYDYSVPMPNPTEGFLHGLQIASAMQQQRAAQDQARRRQETMGRLTALGNTARAQDYIDAAMQFPEDREMFMQSWEMLDEGRRDGLFKAGSEAYTLLTPGADGTVNSQAAIDRLEEYALGYENAGDSDTARQLRDAIGVVRLNPEAGRTTIGTMLAFADGERFKNVATASEPTSFQRDFDFIKQTFGDDAAAEFAQFGRGGVVSIPLGGGQTYVGPASLAPGASRWQEQGGSAAQPQRSAPEILSDAAGAKRITQAEANVIRQSLGPGGQAAFEKWRTDNKIKVIVRTGTDAEGRRVVQYDDETIEYAD